MAADTQKAVAAARDARSFAYGLTAVATLLSLVAGDASRARAHATDRAVGRNRRADRRRPAGGRGEVSPGGRDRAAPAGDAKRCRPGSATWPATFAERPPESPPPRPSWPAPPTRCPPARARWPPPSSRRCRASRRSRPRSAATPRTPRRWSRSRSRPPTTRRKAATAVSESVAAMQSIAKKVTVIEEIAYRTDLLALERRDRGGAGRRARPRLRGGRGEVRKLAERSQLAAKEVGDDRRLQPRRVRALGPAAQGAGAGHPPDRRPGPGSRRRLARAGHRASTSSTRAC